MLPTPLGRYQFFFAVTEQFASHLIDVHEFPGFITQEYGIFGRLKQHGVHCLRFPQCLSALFHQFLQVGTVFSQFLLGTLDLGDVAEDHDGANDVPLLISYWRPAVGNRPFRSVSGYQYRMIGQTHDNAFPEHLGCRIISQFSCLLVDDVENVFQRLAHSLCLVPAGQVLGNRIHEGHKSLGVGSNHCIANAPQRCGQPLVALP